MSPRPARRREQGSFRSLVDQFMRVSFPERSAEWIDREVDSAVIATRETTGRPVVDAKVGDAEYATSSASAGANCVEVAQLPNGSVLVRNSKNPAQPPILIAQDDWRSWVAQIKEGRYDDLA